MIEVRVPEVGESITEGTIGDWSVSEGDQVNEGDILVELETDKVNMEINAEHSGVLAQILKQPGDNVEVGEVIAKIEEGASAEAGAAGQDESKAGEQQAAPQEEAPSTPAAAEQKGEVHEQQSSAEQGSEEQGSEEQGVPLASPAARKMARERGIQLSEVRTQDPTGRVTAEDVKAHEQGTAASPNGAQAVSQQQQAPAAQTALASSGSAQQKGQGAAQSADPAKPVERQRMSRRRITIANRLVQAQQDAAMLTTFNEVDMSAILDVRKRRKEAFKEQHDVNLGFMSFFTKAVVGALKAFPYLNAEIDGDDILLKKYYDIGIAVSTDEGLVVPVVREADQRTFADIEREVGSLAKKARDNQLSLSDLQGGTFTITNGGIFGSLLSTPILNTPQVGILGMHKIQTRPVAIDDERMENRPMMYIALSYDHRIIDGSEAVRFLVKIKELLEDPEALLLEG